MSAELKAFWDALVHLTGREVVDIALVAFLIYGILKLIKDTRAVQMVYGLLVLGALYLLATWARLSTLEFVLRNAMLYIGIAVIVIFQNEIRSALVQFGRYLPRPFGGRGLRRHEYEQLFEEVILAVTTLAAERIGALIVFERAVGLQNFIETGVRLDARVSYDLLVSIFNPRVPLHDGAVIIRGDRIVAASCFLPLTLNPQLSKELGTRHRAAIGITEDTDAVAIVVSEETGIISFVAEGQITRHLDATRLRHFLRVWLSEPPRASRALSHMGST
ncbi:MAG: diadenylate cyclase CdaA [Blastocatellia bacterium]|nr:diadenylate cyclase CdaA [Blastocatellia bacterium]MDW8256886.1 diadenylate cyclase CdaA [Acidobacteriota bacterium]